MTIRDVPEEVRDELAREARENGQSLQGFLLGLLRRRAAFSRNRSLLLEIEADFAARADGPAVDAASSAQILAQERRGSAAGRALTDPQGHEQR